MQEGNQPTGTLLNTQEIPPPPPLHLLYSTATCVHVPLGILEARSKLRFLTHASEPNVKPPEQDTSQYRRSVRGLVQGSIKDAKDMAFGTRWAYANFQVTSATGCAVSGEFLPLSEP